MRWCDSAQDVSPENYLYRASIRIAKLKWYMEKKCQDWINLKSSFKKKYFPSKFGPDSSKSFSVGAWEGNEAKNVFCCFTVLKVGGDCQGCVKNLAWNNMEKQTGIGVDFKMHRHFFKAACCMEQPTCSCFIASWWHSLALFFRCNCNLHSKSLEHRHYIWSATDCFLVPHGFGVELFSELNYCIGFLAKAVSVGEMGKKTGIKFFTFFMLKMYFLW